MRILILTNHDAGLYKFRKEVIEALLKKNEVRVSVPKGEFIERLRDLGCEVCPCELLDRHGTNPLKELRLYAYYKRILKEYKPQIVLTYTIKPNVYGGMACAGLGIPYVVNITGLGTAVENGGIMQRITVMLYRLGLRKAKKVFFQNVENKEFMLRHGVVKGSYDMLPGSGVNLEQYQVFDYPKGDVIDFAFIARVMKEKGIEEYLEAAKYIRKKYPHTRFHICGFCEQDYRGILEKLEKQQIILYHGVVDDMTQIYEKVSCTVHPTYYPEGLSNVLLESCACGRPIITTDRAGCREVVDDGVNGYIVRAKDSQDLIEQIEKFLALTWEQRRQMGLEGRRKVEREFSRKLVVSAYLEEVQT
jgi:galacturonosyltransferase